MTAFTDVSIETLTGNCGAESCAHLKKCTKVEINSTGVCPAVASARHLSPRIRVAERSCFQE